MKIEFSIFSVATLNCLKDPEAMIVSKLASWTAFLVAEQADHACVCFEIRNLLNSPMKIWVNYFEPWSNVTEFQEIFVGCGMCCRSTRGEKTPLDCWTVVAVASLRIFRDHLQRFLEITVLSWDHWNGLGEHFEEPPVDNSDIVDMTHEFSTCRNIFSQ